MVAPIIRMEAGVWIPRMENKIKWTEAITN